MGPVELCLDTMKLLIVFTLLVLHYSQASPNRQKRDTTCAFGGRTVCNYRCKATGYAEGDCAWNTETGAFNCKCSQEKRGIRYFQFLKIVKYCHTRFRIYSIRNMNRFIPK